MFPNGLVFWFTAVMWALQYVLSLACPDTCLCLWKSGKEMVNCNNQGLVDLPEGIDSSTQVLYLSHNNLTILPDQVFLKARLLNLQRIYLSHCQLLTVHSSAFRRLANLVELDISYNVLNQIPSETFKDFPDLRRLTLSGNPIELIPMNAFANLVSLNILDLSQCRIEIIDADAFKGLKNLRKLKLDNNQLITIQYTTLVPLTSINAIELYNNNWNCDCHLRSLRKWLIVRKIHYSLPVICNHPIHNMNKSLVDLLENDLACRPFGQTTKTHFEILDGKDVILLCKVSANPAPKISWFWKGRKLKNSTFIHPRSQYLYISDSGTYNKTSALNIVSVSRRNSGKYTCLAENPAGKLTVIITLDIVKADDESEAHVGHIVGLFLGVMILTMGVFILCLILVKHKDFKQKYVRYVSIYRTRRAFRHRCDDCRNHSEVQMLTNSRMLKASCRRTHSPDTMTFLVNDFGTPRSPYINRLDSKPDVVHISEPAKQDTRSDGCNNKRKGNGKKDIKPDMQFLMDKIENSMKSNKDDESADEDRYSWRTVEDKSSKCNLDIDKLMWKESYSSSNEYEEEIEMKVRFDHMSAESTWKRSNLSLPKYVTVNNEWPIKNTDLFIRDEWLGDDSSDVKGKFFDCKYNNPKYNNQDRWWSSQELSDDNIYNICSFDKMSLTNDKLDNSDDSNESRKSEPDKTENSNSSSSDFLSSNLSPRTCSPFANFFYDSRETDL